jgi:hypothetical protein
VSREVLWLSIASWAAALPLLFLYSATHSGCGRCCATTCRCIARSTRPRWRWTGKWLLRCSDPALSAEDIALGYKQLIEVERGWRDLKTHLDLRPIHHRKEDRIRAHVLLCWLALLLIRIAETRDPTRTWRRIREHLDTLHIGVFAGNAGQVRQRTELTAAQRDILAKLGVSEPARFLQLDPTTRWRRCHGRL